MARIKPYFLRQQSCISNSWEVTYRGVFWFMAQGHFLSLTMVCLPLPDIKKLKYPYLGSWTINQKNRTLSFSLFSRMSSVLSFLIHGPGAKILAFSPFDDAVNSTSWALIDNMAISRLYLSPWAKIWKTKDTLFSSSFNVWENKVPLVLLILVTGTLWICRYFPLTSPIEKCPSSGGIVNGYRKLWKFTRLIYLP